MGRIFEVRKATMFKRFDRMAKQFTRIGKEIVIAVKASGPNPDDNPALRRCYQNARSVGMPKDRVEAAIKRAMGKDTSNYEEILYEGYAPHGVALLVETATDNHVRTVANVKSHFNKGHGALGNSGSVSFQFKKMGGRPSAILWLISAATSNSSQPRLIMSSVSCEFVIGRP